MTTTPRKSSADVLKEEGITFTEYNYGAVLVVPSSEGAIRFWPGNGLWCTPTGYRGRGVSTLIQRIKVRGKQNA